MPWWWRGRPPWRRGCPGADTTRPLYGLLCGPSQVPPNPHLCPRDSQLQPWKSPSSPWHFLLQNWASASVARCCPRLSHLSRALAPVPGCVNFPFPSQLPVTRSPAQTSMRRTLPRRGLNKPRAQNPSAAPIACAPRLMPFPQLLPTLTTCSPHGAERRAPVRPGLSCFPGARPSDLDPWGRAQGPAHSRECGRWFRLPRNQAPWAPVGEWARKPMEDALGKVRLNSRTWRSLATRAVLTSEEIARGYYGPGSSSEPAPPGEFRREAGCRTHSDAWF